MQSYSNLYDYQQIIHHNLITYQIYLKILIEFINVQIESNRKREAELQKLRKLLEESQLENEDAMNVLRKKHQDACLDYTDQIEQLQKKNSKFVFFKKKKILFFFC